MARHTGPKGKLVRRFGSNIFENPKFDRLLERKSSPPGQHGNQKIRRKLSEYARQLLEKQKLRNTYGLLEKQFRRTFERAQRQSGISGDNLLVLLETRLDNSVFRAGLGVTRMQARQLINHGHLMVNSRKVDIPSYQLKPGDKVSVNTKERSRTLLARCTAESAPSTCAWLETNRQEQVFKVIRRPQRQELDTSINENLIIELYSK